jgi:hypothetical protein
VVFELITTLPDWAWADMPVNATNTAAIQMEESREKKPRGKVFLVFMAILVVDTRVLEQTDSTAFRTHVVGAQCPCPRSEILKVAHAIEQTH